MPTEPRNLAAESAYRAAWSRWCLASCQEEKRILEAVMDEQQVKIGTSPADPRWKEFADSLPGFREFWRRWFEDSEGKVGMP